jgi:hypothetical protein
LRRTPTQSMNGVQRYCATNTGTSCNNVAAGSNWLGMATMH